MSILLLVAGAGAFLILGGRFYAPLIARVLGEREDRVTPATRINDGRDYVPTRTPIVFAHHYASIAGAGPIIGPVIALYYGWLPALLWILIGGVFLGAVHDFAATHIALREGGRNIAVVARRYLGPTAFVMMLVMLVALLVLVCAAFLDLSATALTSKVGVETLELPAEQRMFRTEEGVFFAIAAPDKASVLPDSLLPGLREQFEIRQRPLTADATLAVVTPGEEWELHDHGQTYPVRFTGGVLRVFEQQAVIGGIASMSVIIITVFSPLIGFFYLKRRLSVWMCSALAIAICALSIAIGLVHPVQWGGDMESLKKIWKGGISIYVLISAGLPVWLFLQSRDFINVHILYIGIIFLIIALVAAGVSGGGQFNVDTGVPMNNWTEASQKLGPGWPVLFVIIACGAVSGFHSLCAGGTTCKQLNSEKAARHVGYYAMLLESFLAVCVVGCLIVGLTIASYRGFCHPDVGKGNAVLTFAMSVGRTAHVGLGLPIAYGALGAMLLLEGFLVTTLDTAIRLTRYMIEEGWATFFRKYDVFAETTQLNSATDVDDPRGTMEMTGAGGMSIDKPSLQEAFDQPRPITTHGLTRTLLKTLRLYWINSGLAVALMLLLGWGNGYTVVWKIFGSANQLLGALTLVIASCWLAAKARPVRYTLLPAVFMLVTSMGMLLRLLFGSFYAGLPDTLPLFITAIVVLAMTAGVLLSAIMRYVIRKNPR